ncbi:hypothetical protein [Sphingomonas sp. KR3-1]|uniref:hypothetical protein n=1 Tax=Sphingomonas sp. KR3-1 TaxID=3156611 RepID=UPI0032B34E68
MLRTKLLFAALLALLPMPALADITAHYTAGGKELVVEADQAGNSRLDVAGKFAIIHREGTDYVVIDDKDGPKVFELAEMASLIKGFIPKGGDPKAAEMRFGLAPGAAVAIAGQQGATWNLMMVQGDEASQKRHVEIVVAADPALAPVGDVFRRAIAIAADFFGQMFPAETGFSARLTELFAKGTPLRITPVDEAAAKPEAPLIEFKAFDTARIDPKHFELPAPVTSADELFSAMDGMMKPGGGKIQTLP